MKGENMLTPLFTDRKRQWGCILCRDLGTVKMEG